MIEGTLLRSCDAIQAVRAADRICDAVHPSVIEGLVLYRVLTFLFGAF